MKFLIKSLAVASVILLGVVASPAQQVRYNFLPDIDFTKYKSYRWGEVKGDDSASELGGRIKTAIESELARKGLTKVEAKESDLVVAFQLAVTDEKHWQSYQPPEESYWGWGGWGGWGSSSETKSTTIAKGTLNLDIYDSALKKQVWRGEVAKVVKRDNDPKKIERNVRLSVAKLLHNYPPLALKKGP